MSDLYIRIYNEDELGILLTKYEKDTECIKNMTPETWEVYKASKPMYSYMTKEECLINRKRTIRYILSPAGVTKLNRSKDISKTINKIEINIDSLTKQLNQQKLKTIKIEQQARDQIVKEREAREQQIKDQKELAKKYYLEESKERLINPLIKQWNKDLIEKINKCTTIEEIQALEIEVIEAMDNNDTRKKNIMKNKLDSLGLTKETNPELFDDNISFSRFKILLSNVIKDKKEVIFENVMKFKPVDLNNDIHIRKIDKRNYTDNTNPKVFDIIELDIGVTYGSNIKEKMKYIRENQKEIIKYCYFKIFEKFTNIHNDLFFPIRFIKPTVYKASGIKATDTVDLCVIFELKTAKKNNQGE